MNPYNYINNIVKKAMATTNADIVEQCLRNLRSCYGHYDERTSAKLESHLDNAYDAVFKHLLGLALTRQANPHKKIDLPTEDIKAITFFDGNGNEVPQENTGEYNE